jgi:hypothetical protein
MFRRLLFDHWVAIFPIAAFITAFAVYVCFTYKAFRMRPSQVNRFSNLPFNDQPAAPHDDTAHT